MDLAINSQCDLVRRPVLERLASIGLLPVTNLSLQGAQLAARRAGHIVTQNGRLIAVFGRWWPYLGNHLQAAWDRRFRSSAVDRCELFYHCSLSAPQFLTLSYIHSGAQTSIASIFTATLALDAIAKLKGSLAIVCNVTNDRISDRALKRLGWESHCPTWSGRHFIKRFYGVYSPIPAIWQHRLQM